MHFGHQGRSLLVSVAGEVLGPRRRREDSYLDVSMRALRVSDLQLGLAGCRRHDARTRTIPCTLICGMRRGGWGRGGGGWVGEGVGGIAWGRRTFSERLASMEGAVEAVWAPKATGQGWRGGFAQGYFSWGLRARCRMRCRFCVSGAGGCQAGRGGTGGLPCPPLASSSWANYCLLASCRGTLLNAVCVGLCEQARSLVWCVADRQVDSMQVSCGGYVIMKGVSKCAGRMDAFACDLFSPCCVSRTAQVTVILCICMYYVKTMCTHKSCALITRCSGPVHHTTHSTSAPLFYTTYALDADYEGDSRFQARAF